MPNSIPRNRESAPATPPTRSDAITRYGAGVVVVTIGSLVLWAFLPERAAALATALTAAAVLSLAQWVVRARPPGDPARGAAATSAALIVVDALTIGAIALANWPDSDATWGRIALLATHVTLTLALLGALSMTVWHLGGAPANRWRGQGADGSG